MNCPICKKPTTEQYKPFCCKRCADLDLGRWFNGNYSVPVVEMDDEPEAEEPEPDQ